MKISPSLQASIKAYLGFSTKAGKTVFGTDRILCEKRLPLILIDETLSENAQKKIRTRFAEEKIIIVENLSGLSSRETCKALAVKEINLAKAIVKCFDAQIKGEGDYNV